MRLYRQPTVQWYGFFISMPFVEIFLNHMLYGPRMYTDWRVWVISVPLIFVLGALLWFVHYQNERWLTSSFPGLHQTTQRVTLKLLINVLLMAPTMLLIPFVYHKLAILGYRLQSGHVKMVLILGMALTMVFQTLWEVVYIIDKFKETLTEKELLRQMGIQQEFENLKSQVNPHFLFNCFNTLSSLISDDKEKAAKFLDELSKVYRYLLNSNNDGVATLQSEIRFIESYLNLLKTRHGDALQVYMEIDEDYYPYLLPSLSLQLLVENAVKHNIVSRQQPLTIEIFTTPARQLVVNNTLQRKQKKEKSTRIGLRNIQAKYQLLQEDGFQIVEAEKNFMAVLPLLGKH